MMKRRGERERERAPIAKILVFVDVFAAVHADAVRDLHVRVRRRAREEKDEHLGWDHSGPHKAINWHRLHWLGTVIIR